MEDDRDREAGPNQPTRLPECIRVQKGDPIRPRGDPDSKRYRIAVWRRMAVEDAAKKVIIRRVHDILPNHIAGGMDATEGTYVWDHIQRGCSGGE